MKIFDIDNVKFSSNNGDYLYVLEIENNNCFIERIKKTDGKKQVDFINIISGKSYIVRILYENDKSIYINLSIKEKDDIVNDIINVFENNYNIKDFIIEENEIYGLL